MSRINAKSGMSMAETVFAASVLAILFLALLNLLSTSFASVRQVEHRLAAGALAQCCLDECRGCPYEHLQATDAVDLSSAGPLADMLRRQLLKTTDGVELTPTLALARVGTIPRDRLTAVTVTVCWSDRAGTQTIRRNLRISALKR